MPAQFGLGTKSKVNPIADGSWLSRERVIRIAAISAAAGLAMLLFLWAARSGTVDRFGQPVGSDFTAFWNAGRIANAGHPAQAWDLGALNAAVRATHGTAYPIAWLYPPVFLLVASALAAMPYLTALLLWQLFSLSIVAVVLQRILKDRAATAVALASPLTPMVLAHGQNAFLTAGLLGSGLLLLERRPWLGGFLLGALVYKPQLALVIGPLLLFTRNWRALAAAILAAAALIALSWAAFGAECWTAFAQSLAASRAFMEQGAVGFHKSASLFAVARMWGGPVAAGYAVQIAGMAAALVILWRSAKAVPNIRSAGACAAAALSTPYLLDYDLAIVGLGAVFLYAEARQRGFQPYERFALAFIWAVPWISRPAAQYALVPLGAISILLLGWFAWRSARQGIAMPPLTCSVCPVTYPASLDAR